MQNFMKVMRICRPTWANLGSKASILYFTALELVSY